MRIIKNALAATTIVVFISGSAFAGIVGSKHDMTWNGQTGNYDNTENTTAQVCVYCHTPHKASGSGGPLWNRAASNATYTMYGTTLGGVTTANTPGPESVACLGCHDGTVAIDSIGNVPGSGTWTSNNNKILSTSYAYVGTDLSDDHPVSLTYTEGNASLNAKNSIAPLKLFGVDQVECATCHDVHNGVPTNPAFLRVDDSQSLICTTCHAK